MYRSEHRGLNRAIARVYLQNRDLARLAGDLRDYYVHGGERPAELEPLSRALRCENNGAHGLLENVLTEAKRLGRGHVPGHAVEYWLFGRSGKLLDELRAIAKLLPGELKALATALRRSVEGSRNTELEMMHVMLNESGIDADSTHEQWKTRLNKLLRDLKGHFNANAQAFDDIEIELERMHSEHRPKNRVRRRPPPSSAQAIKRKDLADIRREVRRRCADRTARHLPTDLKKELERLYKDVAWSRRCHQWSFPTLYQYVVEKVRVQHES